MCHFFFQRRGWNKMDGQEEDEKKLIRCSVMRGTRVYDGPSKHHSHCSWAFSLFARDTQVVHKATYKINRLMYKMRTERWYGSERIAIHRHSLCVLQRIEQSARGRHTKRKRGERERMRVTALKLMHCSTFHQVSNAFTGKGGKNCKVTKKESDRRSHRVVTVNLIVPLHKSNFKLEWHQWPLDMHAAFRRLFVSIDW